MTDSRTKATSFTELHIKGDPIIIYNAWDGGSAKTIASCGAKAIATGDHPVGFSHGFSNDDFDDFTFDMYLPTIKEIARAAGDLPYSVDINNANGLTGDQLIERIRIILETGAVGINYEDGPGPDGNVLSENEQAARIKTIRETADAAGVPLFINARTNIFIQADSSEHEGLLDEGVARAEAYAAAGASGFFVPGLLDIDLITQLTARVELPVNIIRLPGAPSTKELATAGVARVSYGPMPQIAMTEWLKQQATTALRGDV